jgi:hypothetical protein
MEFLNFDPSEFIVLEDAIEFDETIQRPEKIRFYTLGEQEVDAYEKLLPKGRVTQHQRDILKGEVSRIRDLYEHYVVTTVDDYLLREPESGKNLSWVYPVYATNDYRTYDWETSWISLYENMRAPNFYPRMVSALPKPFADTTEGLPISLENPTEFLNADGQKPRRALPIYNATKTILHEDKTIDIGKYPIPGSEDTVNFVGYYLAKRPLDLPNPFEGHPFLKSNEPNFIETTSPLEDVVPSLDAVLTHAVPNTPNPYEIAGPYLKLYDIKLANIPWSSWKVKFPQAEVERAIRSRKPIPFPEHEQSAPGEKIQSTYKAEYSPGLSAREWLMRRDDAGEFVIKALLSKVIDNGSVQSIPGINLPVPEYPATTPAECSLEGLSFQEFITKGILRQKNSSLQCVPLEFVKQERARVGYANRLPWKETTPTEILDTHLKALRQYRSIEEEKKDEFETKTPMKAESLLHQEVISIKEDPKRTNLDKVRDIQALVKDQQLANNIYTDADGNSIVCSHTLAVLGGDLARDRLFFYDVWTAPVDGYRTCKYCGEQIGSLDFVDQDEFTEEGFVIKHKEALSGPTFHGGEITGFTSGLQKLKDLFDMDNPSDAVVFLILSLLQVLPDAKTLQPFLMLGRQIVKKVGSKDTDQFRRVKGTVGLAIASVLIQAHIPTLLPRRSFGSRPLKLDGYPRDEDEPGKLTIVDSLMMVIENMFRAFPTTLSGPSQQLIRGILTSSSGIRSNALVFIKKEILSQSEVKQMLVEAKSHHSGVQKTEQPKTLLPVLAPPKEFGVITKYDECPSARPILGSAVVPPIVQADIPLRKGILPASGAIEIVKPISVRTNIREVSKDVLQQFPKTSKIKIEIGDDYQTNLTIASHLADVFQIPLPIREISPTQKPTELRDIGRGYLITLLNEIQKDPVKVSKLAELRTKDVALYTLFADYKEEKAQSLKLRAKERLKLVEEMSKYSDFEREVIGDLLKIGLAPYIITNRDRELFAREAEQFLSVDPEVGVGLPQDYSDQGDVEVPVVDAGNYGDYNAFPFNDGRDYTQPSITDDPERSI